MIRFIILIFIYIFTFLSFCSQALAFWIWTPESNEWVNPKYSVKDTPGEQLKYAVGFYDAKKYKEAVQEFEKLIKHYPRAREAPEAQFYIAKSWEDQGKLYEAFKQYQKVVDKYPFSERSAEIVKKQFDIGDKLLNGSSKQEGFLANFKGDDYDIIDIFKTIIKNAPYGKLAPLAQYKIGLYLIEKQLYQE